MILYLIYINLPPDLTSRPVPGPHFPWASSGAAAPTRAFRPPWRQPPPQRQPGKPKGFLGIFIDFWGNLKGFFGEIDMGSEGVFGKF